MNQKIRLTLSSFIAVSIIGLVILIFAHYRTKDNIKVVIDTDKRIGVEITGLHYSGTGANGVLWRLDAARARRMKGAEVADIEDITAVFQTSDNIPYTLTAKEGRFKESDGTLHLFGGVVMESKAGEKLTTESLDYFQSSREITTRDPVTITSSAIEIKGVGLRVELDTGKVRILKDVKAVVHGDIS